MKKMKNAVTFYINHSALIGAILFLIPAISVFAWVFTFQPFRSIYVVRFILTVAIGGAIAAFIHRYGISLWISKHFSSKGPAGIFDGIAIGAAVGLFMALVPALFSLIQSNNLEQTLSFIMASYLASALLGGILGGAAAAIGRKYVPRKI
jgi:hypothetical protein